MLRLALLLGAAALAACGSSSSSSRGPTGATMPADLSEPAGPQLSDKVMAELWYSVPVRCSQGPFLIDLPALENRWGESVEVMIHTPRRVRFTMEVTAGDATLANKTLTADPNGSVLADSNKKPENERCVADIIELSDSLPGAGAGTGGAPGTAVPGGRSPAGPENDKDNDADGPGGGSGGGAGGGIALTTFTGDRPGQPLYTGVGASWDNDDPDRGPPLSGSIRIRLWSGVPNDLENVFVVVVRTARRPNVDDDAYAEHLRARARAEEERQREEAARREAEERARQEALRLRLQKEEEERLAREREWREREATRRAALEEERRREAARRAEAEARLTPAERERRRRAAEMAARKRREAEEAERLRREQEAARLAEERRRQAEESRRREEEIQRMEAEMARKEAEERARKRREREAAARRREAYCAAHKNDTGCWGTGGFRVFSDLQRRKAERESWCASHPEEARCWTQVQWQERRVVWDTRVAKARVAVSQVPPEPTGPPPLPRAEVEPPRPSVNAEWRPGYWHWDGSTWHWLAGQWRVPESDIAEELTVQAPSEAPAPRVETPPPPPVESAVWVAGYWQWDGSAWVWVAGSWQLPPGALVEWQPPRWVPKGDVQVFVPGTWIKVQVPGSR